jgi:tRNA dimethylallyltransferase
MKTKSIIITAPTATGKTKLAIDLCRKFNGELISADSRQVYRGLDYGTGKDLPDYLTGGEAVNHHLIDVVGPNDEFSLYAWRHEYINSYKKIQNSGKLPFVCGGTPLYLDMLLRDYELSGEKRDQQVEGEWEEKELSFLVLLLSEKYPELFSKTDLTQKSRVIRALEIGATAKVKPQEKLPEVDYLVLAPYWHRKVVHQRIAARLETRWEPMIEECENLLASGVTHERLQWFGLEYRAVSRFLLKEINKQEAFEELLIRIRKFAKRQDIWFRKMERAGTSIYWLDGDDKLPEAESLICDFLEGRDLPEPQLKISEIIYGPRTQ